MRRLGLLIVLNLVWVLTAAGCHNAGGHHGKGAPHELNEKFRDPDVPEWVKRFESSDRELFAQRDKIVEAVGPRPGMAVADIGAGTGFMSMLFADRVGERGTVYAVEISAKFLEHIAERARAAGLENVRTVLCKDDSVELPGDSIDVAFMCDTYHHLEFPESTMTSVYRALRPGGRLVIVDFKRIPGVSRQWVLDHVRLGAEETAAEVEAVGFTRDAGSSDVPYLNENYILTFTK